LSQSFVSHSPSLFFFFFFFLIGSVKLQEIKFEEKGAVARVGAQ